MHLSKWLVKTILMRMVFFTCFVWVFCDPCNGDAADLRVAEAQKERAVWFGHQHVLSLLLVQETQNRSADKHTTFYQ